jgi:hypothetical protein
MSIRSWVGVASRRVKQHRLCQMEERVGVARPQRYAHPDGASLRHRLLSASIEHRLTHCDESKRRLRERTAGVPVGRWVPAILCAVVRERRVILRGAAVASVAGGVPSSAYALLRGREGHGYQTAS